ncbi:putative odorant receptor 92a [Venturia canescens]|uniref:putative odorant receptor 92a n=1 Tax=Venturia canescens TaxID=32260 RepID=UPI001C9CE9B6|nr:putative odorant receptor 92a [Venturia canescens]
MRHRRGSTSRRLHDASTPQSYRELGNMQRNRYFRGSNDLNSLVNFLSGNLFPLGDKGKELGFLSRLWVIIAWSLKVTYFTTGLLGSFYFAELTTEEIFKKMGGMGALLVELIVPTAYLNFRRKELESLIDQYNLILIDSDDLRRCVHDTLEPYMKGMKYYMVACFTAACAWSAAPLLQLINNDQFSYADFTIPAYVPGEPFGKMVFVAGVIFQIFGSCSINLGVMSVDLYVIHFIAVLAALYEFVSEEVTRAIRDEKEEKKEQDVIDALNQCIRYHCSVVRIGQRLARVLAFYIGATYFSCILKFCFLAFGVFTFGSANIEKVSYLVFVCGCIVQVFLICSSVEDLLTKSTSVTKNAFHESWYTRSAKVKKIFCMIEVTNQMECRMSAYGIVELVVPTLALVNQR